MQLTTCSKPAVHNLLQVCSSQLAASLQFTICSKSAVHNLQQVCSSQLAASLQQTCSNLRVSGCVGHIVAEQLINNRLTVHILKGCLYGSCVGLLSEKTHLCLYSMRKFHLTCHDYFVVFAFHRIIVTLF